MRPFDSVVFAVLRDAGSASDVSGDFGHVVPACSKMEILKWIRIAAPRQNSIRRDCGFVLEPGSLSESNILLREGMFSDHE
jgi:hypothetical protein